MLTQRELATTLAALTFWKDEITQSGDCSARPYLKLVGMQNVQPLTVEEIDELAAKLRRLAASQ
jgi:hypothetical protein